jgi:tRNA pseudouridine38-40 synthase
LRDFFRQDVRTVGAGRTDAGVHASGQVMSFPAPNDTDVAWVRDRLNRRLAPEISVRAAASVNETFDARRSARWRAYEYRLYTDPTPDPFEHRYALHRPAGLDLKPMRAAAAAALGEHDFSSFCRKGESALVRRIRKLAIGHRAPRRIVARVVADSFCHQMVRSLVGTLLEIGEGRRPASAMASALAARSRASAGPVAPPHALHLVAVGYPRDPFRDSL